MKKSRYTEEQIIGILKQHEAGVKTADLCREHGLSAATFYGWKSKFGGMEVSEAQRLKALEDTNQRLSATVPLNGTKQVNGVTGGSTATGTVVQAGSTIPNSYLYTAPATMPMSGKTVTITVISQADPSKTASATITLQ